MKSLDEYLDIALKVSEKAGEHALKNFGPQKEKYHKKDLEYGIKEDKECNDIYEEFLRKETPEAALYTEEGEQNLDSDLVWVIDPIDGTTNYSAGNPFWNSQICLLKNNEPMVAVIFAPALDQKFSTKKGNGAFLNGKKIIISHVKKLDRTTFSITTGNNRSARVWLGETMIKLLPVLKSPRIFSSCGLEIAYTAASIIDLFLAFDANLWDYAPGVLMIREAGGVVLNTKGEEWTIKDRTLVASNKVLVQKVLKLL